MRYNAKRNRISLARAARFGLEGTQTTTHVLIGPPEEYVHGHKLSIMLTHIIKLARVDAENARKPFIQLTQAHPQAIRDPKATMTGLKRDGLLGLHASNSGPGASG